MSTINKGDYDGGARITTASSGGRNLAKDLQDVADDSASLHSHVTALLDKVVGLTCLPPTSASTQATGAGTLDWNVNVSDGFVVVNGVEVSFADAADFEVFNAATPIVDGNSIVGALVASEVGGTTSLEVVNGTSATTGNEVPPTDAEITTGVTHSRWVKISELTINRTGDTTVTQSQKNSARVGFQSGALSALTHIKGRN